MWVCKRCSSTFSDPDLTWDHGERYITCPVCLSRDLKETGICYVCGDPTDYSSRQLSKYSKRRGTK